MLLLFPLQLDVQNTLANGQFAQFLNFLQLISARLLSNNLQTIQSAVILVRILKTCKIGVVHLIQMLQLFLQLPQQNRLLLLLHLSLPTLVEQ